MAWLLTLALSGCATRPALEVTERRAFDFKTDTLAYSNALVWDYHFNPTNGQRMVSRHEPPPDYTHHCFVVVRVAAQFHQHARFDATLPAPDEVTCRELIREVLRRSPRTELPPQDRVIIPGYANLNAFSAAWEPLLKTECGSNPDDSSILGFVVSTGLSALGLLVLASGFYMIQPNQACAITLFGSYRGSDRNTGLRWVWPWMGKTKISVRANNLISDRIKVNDLRGNPIEMAAQVVWRVVDTAQALYDVDDYKAFVMVQIEAAVRTIGSRYPYDDFAHAEVTLRGNHDEVGIELRKELIARLFKQLYLRIYIPNTVFIGVTCGIDLAHAGV